MVDVPDQPEQTEQPEKLVLSELDGGVLNLTLNRPEKRNALNETLIDKLMKALVDASEDGEVSVVVLRAEGPDFCAGADLRAMEEMAGEMDPVANLADAQRLGQLLVLMRRHSKPIIAAVQGAALAGGAGLATACDLVLARDDAVFGYPEIQLGFVPAMVMALLRRSVGEKRAFAMATGGERFDAEQAAELGLVHRVIPGEDWDDEVADFAAEMASRSKSALSLIKRLLYGMDGLSFEEAIARGAEVNALARLTPDTREGLQQFLERSR